MFKRLRIRLTVVCSLVTGFILIGMALGSLFITEQQLGESGQASFDSDLNSILYHLRSQTTLDHTWLSQTEAGGKLIIHIEDNGKPLLYIGAADGYDRALRALLVRQAQETALDRYGFDSSRPPDSRLLLDKTQFRFEGADRQLYYAAAAAIPVSNGWLSLTVLKSLRPEQDQVLYLRFMFGGLTLLAIALLWLFAWVFTKYAVRPVEESRRRQVEFVSAASHELRSPLAVVQASASAIWEAPPERARHFIDAITSECGRMSRLITDMLTLASADNGTWSVNFEECDLETLLLDVTEYFEPVAKKHKNHIFVDLPDDTLPKCRCDRHRVMQMLSVLTDNAVSYSGEGGKVCISARACKNGVRVCVADNGAGIPDEHKERIFERFYRVDSARSKKEHYGLGLCIAREIALLHRGRLTVEDTPGGGATFVLFLPREQ